MPEGKAISSLNWMGRTVYECRKKLNKEGLNDHERMMIVMSPIDHRRVDLAEKILFVYMD